MLKVYWTWTELKVESYKSTVRVGDFHKSFQITDRTSGKKINMEKNQ